MTKFISSTSILDFVYGTVPRNPGYVFSKPGYRQLINFQGCNPGYKAQDLNIFYLKFDKIMH